LPFLTQDHWKLAGEFDMRQVSSKLHYSHQPLEAHHLSYGLSYLYEEPNKASAGSNYAYLEDFRYLGSVKIFDDLDENRVVADKKRKSISAYTQDQWQITNNTQLTLGVRADNYNDVGTHLSPRMALVYYQHPWSNRLMYGRAFRAPSYSEFYLLDNPRVLGNTALNSETIDTLEFSNSYTVKNLSLSITFFKSRIKNYIDTASVGTNQVQFKNLGTKNLKGIEVEMDWIVNDQWQFVFNVSKNESDLDDDASSLLANSEINWTNQNKFSLSLQLSYDEKITSQLNGKDLVLANSLLRYQFTQSQQVWLKISNLGNVNYKQHANSSKIPEGVPARGRAVLLGIEWTF